VCGVDGGRRFVDVDDFAYLLLVRDRDFDARGFRELDAGLDECVETFFFDAELILAGGELGELAASGEIGLAANGPLRRGFELDAGGGDGDSVFVDDGDGGDGLSRGCGEKSEGQEESTHG